MMEARRFQAHYTIAVRVPEERAKTFSHTTETLNQKNVFPFISVITRHTTGLARWFLFSLFSFSSFSRFGVNVRFHSFKFDVRIVKKLSPVLCDVCVCVYTLHAMSSDTRTHSASQWEDEIKRRKKNKYSHQLKNWGRKKKNFYVGYMKHTSIHQIPIHSYKCSNKDEVDFPCKYFKHKTKKRWKGKKKKANVSDCNQAHKGTCNQNRIPTMLSTSCSVAPALAQQFLHICVVEATKGQLPVSLKCFTFSSFFCFILRYCVRIALFGDWAILFCSWNNEHKRNQRIHEI